MLFHHNRHLGGMCSHYLWQLVVNLLVKTFSWKMFKVLVIVLGLLFEDWIALFVGRKLFSQALNKRRSKSCSNWRFKPFKAAKGTLVYEHVLYTGNKRYSARRTIKNVQLFYGVDQRLGPTNFRQPVVCNKFAKQVLMGQCRSDVLLNNPHSFVDLADYSLVNIVSC